MYIGSSRFNRIAVGHIFYFGVAVVVCRNHSYEPLTLTVLATKQRFGLVLMLGRRMSALMAFFMLWNRLRTAVLFDVRTYRPCAIT